VFEEVQVPQPRREYSEEWVLNKRAPLEEKITNSIDMELVLIRADKFKMGSTREEQDAAIKDYEKFAKQKANDAIVSWYRSEGPRHEVEITKPFYLGVYEVTQKQYREIMGKNPSWFSSAGGGKDKVKGIDTDDFPVESVSWEDAQDFLKKLSARAGERKKGLKYRLPTEAEWEYACRAGRSGKTFHYGNSLDSTQANFDGNYPYGGADKSPYLKRPCKVGSYKANAFGLHDMHGNVWEWCSDWFDKDYYGTSRKADPKGPYGPGSYRVVRGGSWSR
jgi:formylglycine-generating enzyme required for sulfatase activity